MIVQIDVFVSPSLATKLMEYVHLAAVGKDGTVNHATKVGKCNKHLIQSQEVIFTICIHKKKLACLFDTNESKKNLDQIATSSAEITPISDDSKGIDSLILNITRLFEPPLYICIAKSTVDF